MERKVQVVIMVAGLFAFLSAAFGFAAEGTRLKKSGKNIYENCHYPSTPAPGFALTAAALLLLGQITVHAFAGCICCKARAGAPCGSLTAAWISLFFSWIAFVFGQLMLLSAVALNRPDVLFGFETCNGAPAGWAAAGAALALASVFLGIGYYYLMATLKAAPAARSADQQGQGIVMAQPASSQSPPAFIHVDTHKATTDG